MEAVQPQPPPQTCDHCGTVVTADARFCKNCGAALRPPPTCPSCGADTQEDAKFCAMCGTALIGPRPPLAPVPTSVDSQSSGSVGVAEEPTVANDDRARFEVEAARLRPRRPESQILSNVLVFVAFLSVLVVVLYYMNKDAPKTVSPFEGGPPMATASPSAPPPSGGASAAVAGEAVIGEVRLADGQAAGGGTLFVILRQPGVSRGPPVAVRKFDAPTFPQTFSVTGANTMLKGMPFTGPFDIHVRLDQDGNAMTKSAGDLVASQPATGVLPGNESVVITLDKRL